MPGIILHNRILNEAIQYLSKKKKVYSITRSIESLMKSIDFRRAAFFGAIGPNIFDYIPFKKRSLFGSEISFLIHDGGSTKLISAMLNRLFSLRDHNNEWASTQRAYLYGFISHIIADSLFHPFMFYWSGFPEIYKRDQINHYREQNLLFSYNMDLYFLHYYENEEYTYSLDNMLPVKKKRVFLRTNKAIKDFLIGSLMDALPKSAKKIIFKQGKKGDYQYSNSFGHIDLFPYCVQFAYLIKKNKNRYFIKFIEMLKRKKIFFSDFIIRYPEPRKINKHILNLHRERWFYPGGAAGLHYESVEDLMKISREQIVDIWEKIELKTTSEDKSINDIMESFQVNALTGEEKKGYREMKLMNPIRIRF
jgi:hypothetical protein